MQLDFECVKCGTLVSFSKGDVKNGNIPKVVYCPKCQPKAGWMQESEKKSEQVFAGEPVTGKKKWERKVSE